LYANPDEHPEEPNDVIIEKAAQPNLHMINLKTEHPTELPEEPNDVSLEEEVDPNDIEKIILDEGTANHRKEESIIPDLS
jgi:hypothetical protein